MPHWKRNFTLLQTRIKISPQCASIFRAQGFRLSTIFLGAIQRTEYIRIGQDSSTLRRPFVFYIRDTMHDVIRCLRYYIPPSSSIRYPYYYLNYYFQRVIIRPLGDDATFITHYRDSFINYSGEREVVEILLPTTGNRKYISLLFAFSFYFFKNIHYYHEYIHDRG